MLRETGIVAPGPARRLESGLRALSRRAERGRFPLDPALEDVHLNVETALAARIGAAAGHLPTGRSRNDQVAVDLALYLRDRLLRLETGTLAVVRSLVTAARGSDGRGTVAAWTHLQPAQRVYWAQLLGTHALRFQRDAERFAAIRGRLRESPLGSGAIAGTSLPIDRRRTAGLLGFAGPGLSSIDGVSDRDASLDALFALALLATHASALAEELVIGAMPEVDRVHLADAFVTTSSLMPHKRNPDLAELARGAAGPAIGRLVAHLTIVKGLPIGYQRDLQAGKPLLVDAVRDAERLLDVLAPMIASTRFRSPPADPRVATDSVELADALVAAGVPFRAAHARVARFLAAAPKPPGRRPGPGSARFASAFPELARGGYAASVPAAEPERRRSSGGSAWVEVSHLLTTVGRRAERSARAARREWERLDRLRRALGAPRLGAPPPVPGGSRATPPHG